MQWIRHNLVWLVLVFVVVLGAFLRLYRIGIVPSSYAFDEVGIMYDAWSISLWHRDQFAHFMPLSFQSFGDYKPPLLIYTLAALYSVFGVHELMIRLLSAWAGIGSIAVMFLLARTLFSSHPRKDWIGLASALIFATSPWSIHLSRLGFEQNATLFLGLTGIWMLVAGLRNNRWWYGSALFFVMSMYTFHTAKVFVPLVVAGFLFVYRRSISWKRLLLPGLVGIVALLPLLYTTLFGQAGARSETLIFFNSPLTVLSSLWSNVYAYLSPSFWIFGHDAVSIRHALPGFGVLLVPWYGLLVISGGLYIFSKQFRSSTALSWYVLLVGFMPSIIAKVSPHVIRSQFALIGTALVIGYCVVFCIDWLYSKRRMLGWVLGGILVGTVGWNLLAYQIAYYSTYSAISAEAFQYGYKEVFSLLSSIHDKKIIMTDYYQQPYIYALFYNKITPQQFLWGGLNQYEFHSFSWKSHRPGIVYVGSPQEIPLADPSVVATISIPHTNQIMWVIAAP